MTTDMPNAFGVAAEGSAGTDLWRAHQEKMAQDTSGKYAPRIVCDVFGTLVGNNLEVHAGLQQFLLDRKAEGYDVIVKSANPNAYDLAKLGVDAALLPVTDMAELPAKNFGLLIDDDPGILSMFAKTAWNPKDPAVDGYLRSFAKTADLEVSSAPSQPKP